MQREWCIILPGSEVCVRSQWAQQLWNNAR